MMDRWTDYIFETDFNNLIRPYPAGRAWTDCKVMDGIFQIRPARPAPLFE